MSTKVMDIGLKEIFLKKINAKPGDCIEIIVKENGMARAKKKRNSISHQTFGIWKNEVDGIKFMDKMRKLWQR